jgi:hypothetical protein
VENEYYQAIDVWKRLEDGRLVRYRCFRIVSTGRYCVQSADYYNLPLNAEEDRKFDRQFKELLIEQAPEYRSETCATLEEAIFSHDREFEETTS